MNFPSSKTSLQQYASFSATNFFPENFGYYTTHSNEVQEVKRRTVGNIEKAKTCTEDKRAKRN